VHFKFHKNPLANNRDIKFETPMLYSRYWVVTLLVARKMVLHYYERLTSTMIGFEKVEKQWGQFAVKCKYTY
jgi:hypothetical protein